jgi:C4-dicarboxylate-specific signal transduction histidine kinase
MSECIFTQSDEGICYSHQQPAALCSIAADALRRQWEAQRVSIATYQSLLAARTEEVVKLEWRSQDLNERALRAEAALAARDAQVGTLRAERDSLLQAATLYCHLHPPQLGGDDLQPLRDALARAEGE